MKMKICENCGGKYAKNMELCPYCGAQSEEAAEKYYQGQIGEIKYERKLIEKLPQRIPRKTVKILCVAVPAFLVLFLLFLGIWFVTSNVKQKSQERTEQENVQKLEELLVNKDYEGLYLYCDALPYTYVSYDKYKEVADVYWCYTQMLGQIDFHFEFLEYDLDTASYILGAMEQLRELSSLIEEKQNDTKRLGNEAAILDIKGLAIQSFKEKLNVSGEIVEGILAIEPGDKDSMQNQELARKIMEQEQINE